MSIKTTVVNGLSKAGATLSKFSPEIWLGVGIVGVGVGVVLACKATLKCDDIVEETQDDIDHINDKREEFSEETYPANDYGRDLAVTYIRSGVRFAKMYAPAIVAIGVGISCIVYSHCIMRARYSMLMGAYVALDEAFQKYKKEWPIGLEATGTYNPDEDNNPEHDKKVRVLAETDPYGKMFEPNNPNWDYDVSSTFFFLNRIQTIMNDRLKERRVVFLNEVYDALGIERTEIGQYAGWCIGNGDNSIDFGLPERQAFHKAYTDYRGMCCPVFLTFNCDGSVAKLL